MNYTLFHQIEAPYEAAFNRQIALANFQKSYTLTRLGLFFCFALSLLSCFLSCQKEAPVPPPPPVDPCAATKKNTALEKIWQNDLPSYVASPYVSMYPLLYGDKVVYSGGFGANQKLVVADAATGNILLEKAIDFPTSSSDFQVHGDYLYYKKSLSDAPVRRVALNSDAPAADFTAFPGKTANYFSFYGNSLVAVHTENGIGNVTLKDTGSGKQKTVFSQTGEIAPPLLWNLPNGDTVLTLFYYTAPKYRLISLDLSTGDTLFSIEPAPGGAINFDATTFILHKGLACLASGDYIEAYDARYGTRHWTYQSPHDPIASTISLTAFGYGDYIVAGGKLGGTSCLSAKTGKEQWRKAITVKTLISGASDANPAFVDDRMFVVFSPSLQAFNLGTGYIDWDFSSPNLSSTNFRAGIAYHPGLKILFVRDDGHILAIRNQD